MLLESRGVKFLGSDSRRIVEFAIVFLQDNFDFALQFGRIVGRVPQRVGLNIKRLLQVFRRHFGMVHRAVVIGGCIQIPTQSLRLARDLANLPLRGSFEEHVLDNVGDSGNAIVFIEIPRLHVRGNAGERHRLLLADDDRQSILEDDFCGLSFVFSICVRFHDLYLKKQD